MADNYPRFTKLIIADIIEKYAILILNDLLVDAIKDTQAYMDYDAKYRGVEVPIIQPELVESTQGTHRTPRATRTPNPDNVIQKRKRKGTQAARETSSPRKSLKIRFKQQKPTSTTPLPPSDYRECDEIHEATQLSLALDKTAKAYEEQQMVVAVKQHMLDEDVEKLVEGEEEESDGIDFADTVLLSDEDFGDRLEPGSHKDKPKEINDDDDEKKDDKKGDDDNDDNDHAFIRTRESGSSKIKTEKIQTPIPSSPRSFRTDLSSDKAIAQKLMDKLEKVNESLKDIVPKLATSATSDIIKDNLPRMVTDAVKNERESSQPANTVINVHLTTSASTATTTSDLQQQLYLKMKSDLQAQVVDPDTKRQKTTKSSKSARGSSSKQPRKETNTPASECQQQQDWDAWVDDLKFDEDQVIPVDETPESINEFQNVNKRVATIFDHERMEATLRDMLSNHFRDAEE
ncbi:hypothetical protein Tco_0944356 [Tanacetum coccineum]